MLSLQLVLLKPPKGVGTHQQRRKGEVGLRGFFTKGRRALKMIYYYYKISETEGSLFELQDLIAVTLKGDNLSLNVMGPWDMLLLK